MTEKDRVFAESFSQIKAFEFDQKVVSVFPDMIKRSVPGYDTILKGIAMLAMKHVKPNSNVYDLGSSLGAVSLTIDQAIGAQGVDIHAIDNSPAMVKQLKASLNDVELNNNLDVHEVDVSGYTFNDASMAVSNFTLQFMPVRQRKQVCAEVYQGLNPGGVFVLSEKVRSSATLIDYYHGYKKINGYSDMEIAQKRQALEDSLLPDNLEHWLLRLEAVGFKQIEVWFRAFNFISLAAVK
ncbi:carboxy-S-adenosyl-L-methionine synthase CmoA [Marinicella sp. S1101]|uniref:carboxy-S-adenosyl-L-methionine synthase CmoA n=1 Tax=Marinicella marina TaxID=2996016 RepID=UPI002260CF52|nr:carboxy-S-adenosyl-L-methionine synthase CmoA [Marinicella marina]MCX7554988.1 carboxy-S-adenosyl-L-methionine synthase CmoA [Marinicella marina]MDJ1141348.1 carboxy-S-adenosyl-L-methionine synthase CmoA [Marinicella marina]